MTVPAGSIDFLDARMRALYVHDERNRLVGLNQWDGGDAPAMHLMRSPAGAVVRFRHDVDDAVVADLSELVGSEPLTSDPADPPRHRDRYAGALAPVVPAEWSGPAYRWVASARAGLPAVPPGVEVREIDGGDGALLAVDLVDWVPDAGKRRPFVAVVADGRAVCVCASARASDAVHEAGVETVGSHRRRGYARLAVGAWAAAVERLGAVPVYSTSWGNAASLATAASLGLELFATDYHVG